MKKPYCLLLPGLDGSGKFFSDFATEISKFCNPIVISYPSNQFLSYAQLADYVASNLSKDKDFYIIAESFSGPVAALLALRQMDQLKGVILVATFLSPPVPFGAKLLSKFMPLLGRMPIPQFLLSFFLLNGQKPHITKAVLDILKRTNRKVLIHRVQSALNCNLLNELKKIQVPILAIRAKRDRIIWGGCMNKMLEHMPDLKIVEVAAPHFVLQAQPEKLANQIIKPFLQICEKTCSTPPKD